MGEVAGTPPAKIVFYEHFVTYFHVILFSVMTTLS